MSSILFAVVLAAAPFQPVREADALLAAKDWPAHLSPKVALAYRLALAQGGRDERHFLLGRSVTQSGLRVTLRFSLDVRGVDVEFVESRGCTAIRLPSKRVVKVGPVLEADCKWSALENLGQVPQLLKVTPTLDILPLPPLGVPASSTLEAVEAPALARASHPTKATGAGVTVVDIDAAVDVFHPFLFRADGGRFAWLDVNNDGAFTPNVDGVDLNKDGVLNVGEVLRVQKAGLYTVEYAPVAGWKKWNDGDEFIAGVDWLFQDENGNGVRDFGPQFGESKPGFGEAVFVVDDVDGDGKLDVGERIVRLGSSKLKAVLDFQLGTAREFVRGTNLSQFSATVSEQLHGTMVLGSLGGGDARYTRFHGVATDADLLLAFRHGGTSVLQSLVWGQQNQADIALWEMANWYFEAMDGSSDLEAACDAAHNGGMLQIGAAGNLGGSQKHTVFTAPTGNHDSMLEIPAAYSASVGANFNVPASANATVSLTLAATTIQLSGAQGLTDLGPFQLQWFTETSLRNTKVFSFYVWPPNQSPLATDTSIKVTVSNPGAPVTVHGYVFDAKSSWGLGAKWAADTTDYGTYGIPGTSDHTMSIGTWFSDFAIPPATPGQLATHSGRGPRMDGMDSVDLVAPEDHITAFQSPGAPWGTMWVGGGTSNASPVAVGVAALLLSLQPSLTPSQLIAQLKSGARAEPQMGTLPNDDWGSGKVSAFRSRYGMPPVAVQNPIARGTLVELGPQTTLNASNSSDPAGLALSFRWDVDDDGVLDAPGTPNAIAVLDAGTVGRFVTLEVSNASGGVARVLLEKEVVDAGTAVVDAGVVLDAGLPDAGVKPVVDAGLPSTPDAGTAPVPELPRGCGCASDPGSLLFGLAGLLLLIKRRKAPPA